MSSSRGRDVSEVFADFVSGCARFLFYLGGVASIAAAGLLIFTCFRLGSDPEAAKHTADALRNVELFNKVLIVGVIGLGVGASVMFWGEDVHGVLQLIFAAALYFAPLYLPSLTQGSDANEAIRRSYGSLQDGGIVLGVLTIVVLIAELAQKARERVKHGVKADQLKYGKNIKAEPDKLNVFLGKCWQMPFCRKFVRDKCPIYHSKRTCWKEQVGCMCEEEVIKGAMENRPIPKDALLAVAAIPRNNRLTPAQKKERCDNCVIYNEHQRQKYRAWLPSLVIGFVLLYVLLRTPLLAATAGVIKQINTAINGATLGAAQKNAIPPIFTELLLMVAFLVVLSYCLKTLEYAVFKLKI